MHTDLSPHLHTPECNKIISELKTCHAENKLARFVGYCNDLDTLVVKCLRQERLNNSAANRAKAIERQRIIRERMQEPGKPFF